MGDKAVLAMDWDAQGMHLWLMGIAWQSDPPCTIPNEEILIRQWLKNPDQKTWDRVWPQIQRGWEKTKKNPHVFMQRGLLREYRKIKQFSDLQTKRINERWHPRRKNGDTTVDTTVMPPNQSGNTKGGNTRAGNTLHSAEVKTTSLPPLKSPPTKRTSITPMAPARSAPLEATRASGSSATANGNGALRPTGPPPICAIDADDKPDYDHEDFVRMGWRSSALPADEFAWARLERSMDNIERVQSKLREAQMAETVTSGDIGRNGQAEGWDLDAGS